MSKINMHCGDKVREGYRNLDVRDLGDMDGLESCSDYSLIMNKDDSLNEIIAHAGCLESIQRSDILDTLKIWHNKLSPEGLLKISFVDMKRLSNSYFYDRIQIEEMESSICSMKSLHDMMSIRSALFSAGFHIKYSDFSIESDLGTIHAGK